MGLLCRLGLHSWSHQVQRCQYLNMGVLLAFYEHYDAVCGRCGECKQLSVHDRKLPLVMDPGPPDAEKSPA